MFDSRSLIVGELISNIPSTQNYLRIGMTKTLAKLILLS